MNKSRLLGAVCAFIFPLSSLPVYAVAVSGQGTWETTLLPRDLDGNNTTAEAYYDTVQNITWLANANLASSNTFGVSLIDSIGTMFWATSNDWISAMNSESGTGYFGYNNWRLPSLSPVNGSSFNTAPSSDGSTDRGTATTTTSGADGGWRNNTGLPVSEMGHLHYVVLGNLGDCDPVQPYCTPQAGGGLSNTGPFSNMQSHYYTGLEFNPTTRTAFTFSFGSGFQGIDGTGNSLYAWAVHDGDIGASVVPLPPAFWLFGTGLLGLIGVARKKGSIRKC